MNSGQGSKKVVHMYRLDSKEYMDMVKQTRCQAEKALKRYGEPTMSLEELRATLLGPSAPKGQKLLASLLHGCT